MGFPKDIYEKGSDILAKRRQTARENAALQRQEIYSALPEIQKIDRLLAMIGMKTIQAVASAPSTLPEVMERLKNESLSLQENRKNLLVGAGLLEAYQENHFSCKLCQDSGYVGNRICTCFDKLLKETAYRHLAASKPGEFRFSNFSLDFYSNSPDSKGLVPRERMAWVKNYCVNYVKSFQAGDRPSGGNRPSGGDRPSPSLLFIGGTGLGKTHLSFAIAEQVINQGFGVVYGSTQNLLARLEKEKFSHDRFNAPEESEKQSYLSLLLECDLLILDDLGTEFLNQFVTSTIYNLINTRLLEGKPCIISTNLSPDEISKRYSERLVSRLFGSYTHLAFLGRDVRIQTKYLKE